jgi:predicted O-methyltransferase YrrM
MIEEECYYFEGELRLYGQLWVSERKAMTELVQRCKPKLCIEVGTFSGGGSTYFIASALAKLGAEVLASSEVLPEFYRVAQSFYSNCRPDLAAHVEFLLGGDPEIFMPLISM